MQCGRTVLKLSFGNSIWLLYLNGQTQLRTPALHQARERYTPFMKTLRLIILLLGTCNIVIGQIESKSTPYDDFIKTFNKQMDTVTWLCEYDKIAWWTSDSVMTESEENRKKLGAEWFCLFENDNWHAYYGKYTNGNFKQIFHYKVESKDRIERISKTLDTSIANPIARSLVSASNQLNNFLDTIRVRFNQYVKQTNEGNIEIWLMPAFTTSGVAVYGGEAYYLFDKTGTTLLARREIVTEFRGFKPGSEKEIWLDYAKFEEPTLGAIFFTWYYKDYFKKITIETKRFRSAVIRIQNESTWIHAAND